VLGLVARAGDVLAAERRRAAGRRRPVRRGVPVGGRRRDGHAAHRLGVEAVDRGDEPAGADECEAEHSDQELRHRPLLSFAVTC
jgi:hypothetical protein